MIQPVITNAKTRVCTSLRQAEYLARHFDHLNLKDMFGSKTLQLHNESKEKVGNYLEKSWKEANSYLQAVARLVTFDADLLSAIYEEMKHQGPVALEDLWHAHMCTNKTCTYRGGSDAQPDMAWMTWRQSACTCAVTLCCLACPCATLCCVPIPILYICVAQLYQKTGFIFLNKMFSITKCRSNCIASSYAPTHQSAQNRLLS